MKSQRYRRSHWQQKTAGRQSKLSRRAPERLPVLQWMTSTHAVGRAGKQGRGRGKRKGREEGQAGREGRRREGGWWTGIGTGGEGVKVRSKHIICMYEY